MVARNNILVTLVFLWCATAVEAEEVREESYLVNSVSIDYPQCLTVDSSELQLACHRLKRGSSTAVIAQRLSSSSQSDRDGLLKITVLFPEQTTSGRTYLVPDDNVQVFYSSGLRWMPGATGCYGFATRGKVEVGFSSETRTTVAVDVALDLKSPLQRVGACKEEGIKETFKAKHINEPKSSDFWRK